MKTRIAQIVEHLGMSQAKFADGINLKQQTISALCAGTREPSERTIADICRVYNVNRKWLETGDGEMFRQTANEHLAFWVGEILTEDDDSFKKRFLTAVSDLDENGWNVLADFVKKIASED